MIYTRLAGGLGNQIFQLAAAMALRHPSDDRLIFDTRSLRQYKVARALELRRFFRLPPWFTTELEAGAHGRVASAAMRMRPGRWLPRAGVNDKTIATQLLLASAPAGQRTLVLDGYFQRDWPWAAFDVVRREISAMLQLDLASSDACAEFDCFLHIRGGDFLTSEHSKVVDGDFYVRALETLRQRVTVDSVYVVTDDAPHASRALAIVGSRCPGVRLHIPDGRGDMAKDFMMLRNAKTRIVGNSTFSWWAAALDPRESITIGPRQWNRGIDRNLILPWESVLSV